MKTFKRLTALCLTAAMVFGCVSFASAGSAEKKYTTETTADGWIKVTQEGGETLGYSPDSGVTLLEDDGFAFKDLNKNGTLDVYEDWRLDAQTRAEDLAGKLSIAQISGLRYTAKDPGADASAFKGDLDNFVRHFLGNALQKSSTDLVTEAVNEMQKMAETADFGVPVIPSMDPPAAYLQNTTQLGLAATFDDETVENVYNTAAKLMRSIGVFEMLGPQADMATEPRWTRASGTFGEDPALVTDLVKAAVTGLQSTFDETGSDMGWGKESVIAQVKHFPGDGAAEAGRESHQDFGKYNVYPGNGFYTSIIPFFDGAFSLDSATGTAAAVMPSYSIAWSKDEEYGELVGSNFSEFKINLLRENGFDGIISTDSLILADNIINIPTVSVHGMDDKTSQEVIYQIIKIGVDRILMPDFGEKISYLTQINNAYDMLVEEYGEEVANKNYRDSAIRLLRSYITVGAFENAYVETKAAEALIDESGITNAYNEVNQKSIVLLKNSANIIKQNTSSELPTAYIPMVYSAGGYGSTAGWSLPVNAKTAAQYFNVVTDELAAASGENGTYTANDIIRASAEKLADCDYALVFLSNPSTGNGYDSATGTYKPISLQYNEYVADGDNVREKSLSQGIVETVIDTPYGPTSSKERDDRTYYGESTVASNLSELESLLSLAETLPDTCKLVACVSTSNAMIFSEFEAKVDAILLGFDVDKNNFLPLVAGQVEPSALLPIQLPANMETVEAQYEDVPRDMECYVDSNGNTYDFAFGLNWSGVINDERVQKYNVPALTEPETQIVK